MGFLSRLFTWWHGATLGTLVTTWFSGRHVGDDAFGNRYYATRDGKRRWVLYNGTVEASRVPPEWHGWMHHTVDESPAQITVPTKAWEAPHIPNLTGTSGAYRPDGSLWKGAHRPHATGDYEAWRPN